jgi:hypothetical protein
MEMLLPKLALPLAAAGLLMGCSDPAACTANIERAVEVEVREAGTDQYLADVTRGVVRDGSYSDSLRVVGYIGTDPALPTLLGAADERPGTYQVHLEAEGYGDWDTTGVRAGFDGCHVTTARFTARLQPQ